MRAHETGKMVATGADNGTTTLLELSEGLFTVARNEKLIVTNVSVTDQPDF